MYVKEKNNIYSVRKCRKMYEKQYNIIQSTYRIRDIINVLQQESQYNTV